MLLGAAIAASINHLMGGALHFLLGYSLLHELDERGLVISLFFGLVFAGGHLNQEVRDYEGDLLNGVRTSAVVFGCQRTFLASLAMLGFLPRLLLGSAVVWGVCLSHGLSGRSGVDWHSRPPYGCNDAIDCCSHSLGLPCSSAEQICAFYDSALNSQT